MVDAKIQKIFEENFTRRPAGSTAMSGYIALINKLEEYNNFLGEIAMDHAILHGYSVSESVYKEGEKLRAEIHKLKEAISI